MSQINIRLKDDDGTIHEFGSSGQVGPNGDPILWYARSADSRVLDRHEYTKIVHGGPDTYADTFAYWTGPIPYDETDEVTS